MNTKKLINALSNLESDAGELENFIRILKDAAQCNNDCAYLSSFISLIDRNMKLYTEKLENFKISAGEFIFEKQALK